ncbi:MAG: aminoacyl-tRNA hydrolase [Candidatus Atribacteria bacterium]|nr:aminoacyl-tRNA hydrolase [Candidatus Atribacteria bacterium]
MRLIAGLGNPGYQYQFTRHNIGFRVVDAFLIKNQAKKKKWKAVFDSELMDIRFKEECIIFVKPMTYMNLSGQALEKIVNYYTIDPGQLLIVYDDIYLPLGRIRIRCKGSSGGHKGIDSIIQFLKTDEIPRLRIGIKNDALIQNTDYATFVLSNFLNEEEKLLKSTIDRSVRAIEDILDFGYEYAMREYNQSD